MQKPLTSHQAKYLNEFLHLISSRIPVNLLENCKPNEFTLMISLARAVLDTDSYFKSSIHRLEKIRHVYVVLKDDWRLKNCKTKEDRDMRVGILKKLMQDIEYKT